MQYTYRSIEDAYGPMGFVVSDRDEDLFRLINRDEAEQLVNMLNELARLRESARWRSVEEGLPDADGRYAIWYSPVWGMCACWFLIKNGKFEGLDTDPPTHWQPLPEPPQ